jgi:GNAT superfamily N-acetyltransferase
VSRESVSTPRDWSVRPSTPDDGPAIVRLHELVFGRAMSLEHWRWQFLANPWSRAVVTVAVRPDGELVGHYALVPLRLDDGDANVVPQRLVAWSILSMIHPEHQRQGVLRALAQAAEALLDAAGVTVGATFLNDNSLPAYTRHFGWTEVGQRPPVYFTVIDPRPPLAARAGAFLAAVLAPLARVATRALFPTASRPRPDGLELRHHAAPLPVFEAPYDRLWDRVRPRVGLATRRDAAYLEWRLRACPRPYEIIEATRDGTLLGMVALRAEDKFGERLGYVVEFLFDPDAPDVGLCLLLAARDQLRRTGCSLATMLVGGAPFLEPTVRAAGWRPMPGLLMPHGMHFCVKARAQGSPAEPTRASRWFLSWSDHDVP